MSILTSSKASDSASILYTVLEGPAAFTPFRFSQKKIPHCVSVKVIYFLQTTSSLSSTQYSLLASLLQVTSLISHTQAFVVIPRLGTFSPWSSKAMDILQAIGLLSIVRIEKGIAYFFDKSVSTEEATLLCEHDPLTESFLPYTEQVPALLFTPKPPNALQTILVLEEGKEALLRANKEMGLGLQEIEIHYLNECYERLNRNPTDAELMMFAQINSEHCRHKIFNTRWWIDQKKQPYSLFQMIKNTYALHPRSVLKAYSDNAAVLKGFEARVLTTNTAHHYHFNQTLAPIVLKVETHNHPTGISPFAGAATGVGGEIRDEAATGRGAYSKAGLSGFAVSHLHIPGFSQPWEKTALKAPKMASSLTIMLEAPMGAASFSNEFGRPNLLGFFRTFEYVGEPTHWGYHKPIMLAGGIGHIREEHIAKNKVTQSAHLIVLGGPALRIGLGGGSASSVTTGIHDSDLDFASVQRANPEMQRRAQAVINACWRLNDRNPIQSIHDVGAGGLSNALPELVKEMHLGATIYVRDIPCDDSSLSPMEIWCNEAQERYVLAIYPEDMKCFDTLAKRERCPYSIVGNIKLPEQTAAHLKVLDTHSPHTVVDLSLSALFEDLPRLERWASHESSFSTALETSVITLNEAIERVLSFPTVANKSFLITIGDRSVGGLVARDQMVGPWQVPVADVAVTANSFTSHQGEAIALGERMPLAILDAKAAARLAIGEAITNIAAAHIPHITDISLSANWMATVDLPGESAKLYDAVEAVGLEMCPALGIAIPVGKDSLSMQAVWDNHVVSSPVSLVITAAAGVQDIRKTLTPVLDTEIESELLFIDLHAEQFPLGGSILAQCYDALGKTVPDVKEPVLLKNFFHAIQRLNQEGYLLAYHDRSDGGLLVTLCEMMFASHCGLEVDLKAYSALPLAVLFSEGLGAVVQIQTSHREKVFHILRAFRLDECVNAIAKINSRDEFIISHNGQVLYRHHRIPLQRLWSETSYRLQALRDHPACAQEMFEGLLDPEDPGLQAHLPFDIKTLKSFAIHTSKPRVAILREQGVNGEMEMAAAFMLAGFEAVDVHMNDLLAQEVSLNEFVGLAVCGGFSYGDVLGAGRGWAARILNHTVLRNQFEAFFQRPDTFTLGVCNGCQMLSHLKTIIPGSEHWPLFARNRSEQFEARFSLVEVLPSPSLFFQGMEGAVMPICVSHGEGRTVFEKDIPSNVVSLRYVDHSRQPTERYPFNPNGSPQGITGLTSQDGRVTLLMPHPERCFRTVQCSWHPKDWGEYSPWFKGFLNLRSVQS